jgi:hypothetical protein
MTAEPAQGLRVSLPQDQKEHFRSDRSEETIQACYELISSGQPLSDILVALKQLGPLNENSPSERGLKRSDTQIADMVGHVRAAAPQWQTAQLTEPLEPRLLREPQNVTALVRTATYSPNSLIALKVRLPSAPIENSSGIMSSRPIRSILFWSIPVLSIVIIGIGGKLLSDVDLRWITTLTTAAQEPIRSTGQSIDQPTAARAKEADPTAPVPAMSEIITGTRPDMGQKQSPAPIPAIVTGRRSSAQPRHTPIQRPPPMGWRIPDRLTDGF